MKSLSEKEIDFDLGIDINALEQEWSEQPRLRFRYGVKLAEAERKVAESKAEMELTYAELDADIRSDPEKYDVAKVTEASVKAAILAQSSYTKTKQALIEAEYERGVLAAAVSAIDQRRYGLQKEVDLWLGNYYSSPRASAENREEFDELNKKAHRRGRARGKESDDDNE